MPKPNRMMARSHQQIDVAFVRSFLTRMSRAFPLMEINITSNEACPIARILTARTNREVCLGGGSLFHFIDNHERDNLNPLLSRFHSRLMRGDIPDLITFSRALTLFEESLHVVH